MPLQELVQLPFALVLLFLQFILLIQLLQPLLIVFLLTIYKFFVFLLPMPMPTQLQSLLFFQVLTISTFVLPFCLLPHSLWQFVLQPSACLLFVKLQALFGHSSLVAIIFTATSQDIAPFA